MIAVLSLLIISVLGGCDSGQQGEDTPFSPQPAGEASRVLRAPFTNDTDPNQAIHIPADAPTIVAFGDSLTAGLGMTPDLSYPGQLQQRLRQEGYEYRVINAGVNGDTTAGGLRRLEWVLRSRPAVAIVELGANDGLRGHRLEETAANLEQIIQHFQSAGVTVILAGMKLPPNYGLDYTSRFEELYRTLAIRHQLALIPFFLEGVAAIPGLNQADGIHPTAQGYTVVVENVMNVLEPVLKELNNPRGRL